MDWENWDLRIVAIILAILSLIGGVLLGFLPLLTISATILFAGICILGFIPKGPPGTSGDLGMAIFVIGGCIVLVLPAWIGYMVKLFVS